ncbi:PAS domain-containing protein [Jannaschia marina]|uniref:PAS domain-containing protein n=1 Tax=Jannaschia marina TaxID=2741674 RepID=UPI0015CCF465|nr:PAS domain-containing protein [Jannaschia marina]
MLDIAEIVVPVLAGFFIALSALLGLLWFNQRTGRLRPVADADILGVPRRFRFRNGYLIDHSDNVGFFVPEPVDRLSAWDELLEALTDIIPVAANAMRALDETGQPFQIDGTFADDTLHVIGHRDGRDVQISIATSRRAQDVLRIDRVSLDAIKAEQAALTHATDTSPALSWAVDDLGRVVWANAAYRALVARCRGEDAAQGWPQPSLFPDGEGARVGRHRRKCRDLAGTELWFDVTLAPRDDDGLGRRHALALDGVIEAEESLRSFIQTLTRSFAYVPVGLAVFDRDGQLVLFNPALMDMTGLDGAWLSRKPRLPDVLDALRDRQKIPEPRDYKTWRDSLSAGPDSTAVGPHVETWTLASGASYRMTARPQDNGATTLLLEDISAGILASRQQRQDRDLFLSLLDEAGEGVVAFDAAGTRVVDNLAGRQAWSDAGAPVALPDTLDGCLAFWRTLCRPSPLWGEIRDLRHGPLDGRTAWAEELRLLDGRRTHVRVLPQPDGRIALTFRVASGEAATEDAPATVLSA